MEDMQQIVNWSAVSIQSRHRPNTEHRQRGLASKDLAVKSAVATAAGAASRGGDTQAACSGGQHREQQDHRAGLRSAVRRGPLRRTPVEGDQRGPDPGGEPHRGGVR